MTLTPSGEIEGGSEHLRALARAVNLDSKDMSARTPVDVGSNAGSDIGATSSELRLDGSGAINLGWSFFGYNGEIMMGNWCSQGAIRDYYFAASDHGASCWVVRWNSDVQTDCKVLVHYGISGFRSDVCRWYTYTK